MPWSRSQWYPSAVPEASRSMYRRAVLGLNGSSTDSLVIGAGIEMGRAHATELISLHVVEVDWRHDLDDEVPGSRDLASTVLDLAEGAAVKARLKMQTELLQARDVGAALVDEAVALEADVIVLGLPYRKRRGGDFALGSTIPYVFQNAPCAVMVIREPVPTSPTMALQPRKD
jgi:nucleotide-binding universal stress UspA family protein